MQGHALPCLPARPSLSLPSSLALNYPPCLPGLDLTSLPGLALPYPACLPGLALPCPVLPCLPAQLSFNLFLISSLPLTITVPKYLHEDTTFIEHSPSAISLASHCHIHGFLVIDKDFYIFIIK
jgi:hypothetical protein